MELTMNGEKLGEIEQLQISLHPAECIAEENKFNINGILFDLDTKLDSLTNQADNLDYLISVASGILCAALDILWVGDFDLSRGREVASNKIDSVVKKAAQMLGCKDGDLSSCVKFLEKKFPIPSDGNTPDFGGGLQHHLRDFAHHPTIVGLVFSLLTQFTYKSYGTDVNGNFLIVDVPKISQSFIGDDVPSKILYGTLVWFFHLVSDVAGSSSTAGKSGGTGIPGPILALAKELSTMPLFKNINVGDNSLSIFLSKLFNGTLFVRRNESGTIIKDSVVKFDLRGELGVGIELGRQSIPVVANECIVRSFYFVRRFISVLRANGVHTLADIELLDWDKVKPVNNPTISRMLTIATGVFTTIDIGEAIITKKYWVSINYVGVGRFAVAIGQDIAWCLKTRDIQKIKQMYENIKRFSYMQEDDRIYKRIGSDMMDVDKLGLTVEQTEILYNLEYLKTLNDIKKTKLFVNEDGIKTLKKAWLAEWKNYMSQGFASFLQMPDAKLHWYSKKELIQKIEENNPNGTWFRLVLLETMLFEPYYPLSLEKDKKGNDVPSKKYKALQNVICGYKKTIGDVYLESFFTGKYYTRGYIGRLRKCYDKALRELNEVLKTVITSLSITAVSTIVAVITAGAFAPAIAVALVGSNFAGLSGAALTSACLAYLGGGAIAIGGAGMAGGTIAVVGGGAVLGFGVGASVGGAVGAASLVGKKNTILQSAKLLVSVKEVFLNDEHDVEYSNSICEKYVRNIAEIEKGIVEMKLKADVSSSEEEKELKAKIKQAEESVDAMKIARKSMVKFISAFEIGLVESNKKN